MNEYQTVVRDLSSRRYVNLGRTPFDIGTVRYVYSPYTREHVTMGIDLATHDDRHFESVRNILLQVADLRDKLEDHVVRRYTVKKTKRALENLRIIYSTLRREAVNHASECLRAATDIKQGTEASGRESLTHSTIRQINPDKKTLENLIKVSRKHLQTLQDLSE